MGWAELWRLRDFRRVWLGESVSLAGSSVTSLALPLTAVLVLHASPLGVGLLAAAQQLPRLLFGLHAGLLADRQSQRVIMVVSDVARSLLLVAVPVLWAFGALSMTLLIVTAAGVGAFTVAFEAAYTPLLTKLLPRALVLRGNAALAASQSVAEIAAPGLGGLAIRFAGAPIALALDAGSFIVSACNLSRIRIVPTPAPHPTAGDLWAGVRAILADPLLKRQTLSAAAVTCFAQMQEAILLLFASRQLHVSAALLGLVYTVAGAFGLATVALVERTATRLGLASTLVAGQLVKGIGALAFAVTLGPRPLVLALLVLGEAGFAAGIALYGVGYATLIQTSVAPALQGRVTTAARMIILGGLPLAALTAGVLGGSLGLRPTLAIGALGILTAALASSQPHTNRLPTRACNDPQ